MAQRILSAENGYCQVDAWLAETGAKSVLVVAGRSMRRLEISAYFDTLFARTGVKPVFFSDFSPNPRYESVTAGVRAFRVWQYARYRLLSKAGDCAECDPLSGHAHHGGYGVGGDALRCDLL